MIHSMSKKKNIGMYPHTYIYVDVDVDLFVFDEIVPFIYFLII